MLLIDVEVNACESNYTAIEMKHLDLHLLIVFLFYVLTNCSQMSLSAVVKKSPLRITHLKSISEWSGWLK